MAKIIDDPHPETSSKCSELSPEGAVVSLLLMCELNILFTVMTWWLHVMAIISHDFEECFSANNDNQCMLVFSSIGLALRCTALLKTKCGNALELTQYYSCFPPDFQETCTEQSRRQGNSSWVPRRRRWLPGQLLQGAARHGSRVSVTVNPVFQDPILLVYLGVGYNPLLMA